MNDLVSVVVPIYNVEMYLSKCVDSILKQTYKNIEVILVDDGSPDNCGAICDAYSENDDRVTVIHKKNGGLSSARNAGLEISTGKYIVFIDSDDWIDLNYIEKLYHDIVDNEADIAVPAFCISFDNGERVVDSRINKITSFTSEKALENFLFNGYLTPCVASKMWKRELWKEIRCPEGKLFEDQYTTYKLLMGANKVVFDPYINYYYFKRIGSIGHSSFSNRTYDLLGGIKEEYEVITSFYPNISSSLKVARAVWELVFINMMINSGIKETKIVKEIQERIRKALIDINKSEYLPRVRKIEMNLFCANFSLYRFVYKKYKRIKGIS